MQRMAMSKARSRSAAILLAVTVFATVMYVRSAIADTAREQCMSAGNAAVFGLTVPFCNDAIKESPNDPYLYAWRGRALVYKGDYTNAITDLNEAIRLDPKIADAFAFRGRAWNAKGEFDKAISDADTAILLDQNNSVAYNVRSVAYWNKGDYRNYMNDYLISLKLDTQFILYFIYRQVKLLYNDLFRTA